MDKIEKPKALTASGQRYDQNGVVIGPWTYSVKRTNELLRQARKSAVRRTRT